MLFVTRLRLIRERWRNRWPWALSYAAGMGAMVLFKLWSGYWGGSNYVHSPAPLKVAIPEALLWAAVVFVGIMIWPGRLGKLDGPSN
jgi:hypothetical protein